MSGIRSACAAVHWAILVGCSTGQHPQAIAQHLANALGVEVLAPLHSAIGYITPADFLAGRAGSIWADRDHRFEAAREARRVHRAASYQEAA